MKNVIISLLSEDELDAMQNSIIVRTSKLRPPNREEWTRRHEAMVTLLRTFGAEDTAQTGVSGDFWVPDEWQECNYLPIVANTWDLMREKVVVAVERFTSGVGKHYLSTIVRPFPEEHWGLTILITSRHIYSCCREPTRARAEALYRSNGLGFLVPENSKKKAK